MLVLILYSGRSREKMLERELARLAGDNWQANLELPGNSSSVSLSLKSPHRSNSTANSKSDSHSDSAVTAEMIEKIKLLVLGMEHRLEIRKDRLSTTMVEARQEAQKYEDLAQALHT